MWVGRGLRRAARRSPHRLALVAGRRRYTYGELHAEIEALASGLRRLGLRPGDRLLLLLGNRAECIVAFFAAARAGLVAVTVPPRGPAGAGEVLHRAAARAAVVEAGVADRLAAAAPADVLWIVAGGPGAAAAPGGGRACRAGGVRAYRWADVLAAGTPAARLPVPGAGEPFYVGYTSGSTGRPKGVVRLHRHWAVSFELAAAEFALAEPGRFLVAGPLWFSAPLFHACHVLELGGTLHLPRRASPRGLLRAIAGEAVTGMFMVPTLYRALLRAMAAGGRATPLPSVVRIIAAGERLDPALRSQLEAAFPRAGVYEYYGASELGFVTVRPPGEMPAASAGRPFRGVEVAVRRPDGAAARPGEVGLLYARSPMVAAGYDGPGGQLLPLADAEGWATAGDLAWTDAAGHVYLAGRRDDVIQVGGAKVHPAEVEAVLARHPGVAEACVFGVPDCDRGQAVAAAVVPRGDPAPTPGELRAFCLRHLAPYQVPRHWLVVPALPRTGTGKVARAALQRRLWPHAPGPRGAGHGGEPAPGGGARDGEGTGDPRTGG